MKASQCCSRRASRQCWRPRAAPALGPATKLVARLAAIPASLQPGIVCVIAFVFVIQKLSAADMRDNPAIRVHLEVLQALLQAGADVGRANCWGEAPLYLSACTGKLGCLRALLTAGAEVNQATENY